MLRGVLWFLILFVSSWISPGLNAQDTAAEPIRVQYGLFVKKVNPDFKQSMFNAEFYWWAIFENDSTKTGISNHDVINLEYVNAVNAEVNGIQQEVQEVREIGENKFYFTGYHQGSFYFTPDFRRYPFDVQKLEIIVENSIYDESQVALLPDTASFNKSGQPANFQGMSDELLRAKNQNYRFMETSIKAGTGIYNTNFGDPEFDPHSRYSRVVFKLSIDRAFIPYISKLLIPLIIILAQAYFVFFIPPSNIDIATSITVTSLLSAIAFQFSLGQELPEIGYLIFVDKAFYTCYLMIALTMAQSLITYYWDDSGNPAMVARAKQLDYWCRYLFPVFFFVVLLILGIFS